jgi:2Fe-2S ferredoxin
MPIIHATRADGTGQSFEGATGQSVMEVLRDARCEEIQALCGGCCTCSTCHVWVEGGFFDALPAMSDQEADLLALVEHRRDTSRLSCQIRLSDALDGIRVALPPLD